MSSYASLQKYGSLSFHWLPLIFSLHNWSNMFLNDWWFWLWLLLLYRMRKMSSENIQNELKVASKAIRSSNGISILVALLRYSLLRIVDNSSLCIPFMICLPLLLLLLLLALNDWVSAQISNVDQRRRHSAILRVSHSL
jgi:hypothetical protein